MNILVSLIAWTNKHSNRNITLHTVTAGVALSTSNQIDQSMVVSVDVNEATHNLHPPGCAEAVAGDIPVGWGDVVCEWV